MKVRITAPCFLNGRLYSAGEEAEIGPNGFTAKCMEKIETRGRKPKAKEGPK